MSEILTNNKYYKDIADTIRQMKGVATTYKPREMASALRDMYSTEVEGVPPLTFPSNGNNLLNYRIDGANGGVGDRTKNLANDNDMLLGYWAYADGTYIRTNTWICTPKIACKGNVDYTFQFANNSRWYGFVWYDENNNFISTNNQQNNLQTGFRSFTAKSPSNAGYLVINIAGYPGTTDTIRTDDLINFQLEESSTVTDYEPYGYKLPVVISGKNLWNDNITFENGTINQNTGADSSYASDYRIRSNFTNYIEPGQYTLNLAGVDRINTIALYSEKNIESFVESVVTTSAIPKTFSLQTGGYIRVALSKVNGNVVTPSEISNTQLERGQIATIYEPYIEPTTTNIYLNEPIEVNESKSLSDTNVNIPTINGTNILSIDTTVQPSNVYVQAPKTNNYNL